jgi:hypothetical protein
MFNLVDIRGVLMFLFSNVKPEAFRGRYTLGAGTIKVFQGQFELFG